MNGDPRDVDPQKQARPGHLAEPVICRKYLPMQLERVPVSSINPASYNPRLDLRPGDGD
jgi:hypothetical protein